MLLSFIKHSRHLHIFLIEIALMLSLFTTNAQEATQEIYYDMFPVTFFFQKEIGGYSFPILFEEKQGIKLPVVELFNFLKIHISPSDNEEIITGFFEIEKNNFTINYINKIITYKGKETALNPTDAAMDMGQLFLSTNSLNKAFAFNIDFNFRSLSATFSTEYELPISKYARLATARENLQRQKGEIICDTTLKRESHLFRAGMLDWSISANQSKAYTSENRLGLGLGAEVLGGETNLWLNYSDIHKFDRNQQRYYWRWVNNESKLVKQIKIGRVNSQSIASILSPMDGFELTNASTTLRKSVGNHRIMEYTDPDWVVELYINNILLDYTRADASGYYTFDVPIVYGSNTITLRFYGPNGEERSEEKIINMPYNFLPKGEYEYRITGGKLLNGDSTTFARVQNNYGISRWLTISAGVEYLSAISNQKYIPFTTFFLQPIPKLIISAEYDHNVRKKAGINYTLPLNIVLGLDYSVFDSEQKAIIYKYLEERKASLSIPIRIKKSSGFARSTFKQYVYNNLTYNMGEILLSGYYKGVNTNFSTYSNWTDIRDVNTYSNLGVSYRSSKGLNIRPSMQYSYSNNDVISYKLEAEKQVLNHGRLSMGYENNLRSNYQSVNVSFKYDFNFMTAYASSFFNKNSISASQSARGSFAFGSGNDKVLVSNRNSVGRSGVSIIPFVDINFNGKFDSDEPLAENLDAKINGGKIHHNNNDPIIRITGLEPFVYYTLTLDEARFNYISWRIVTKTIKLCTDPNQFKKIYVPVHPMGEVSGMITDEKSMGIGRILVNIYNEDSTLLSQVQSEFDGYWTFLGVPPGNYFTSIDSTQASRLKVSADTIPFSISENAIGDIVDIGDISMRKLKTEAMEENIPEVALETPTFAQVDTTRTKTYYINFGFDKANIEPQYYPALDFLAKVINENSCITLLIEAYTDSDGPASYNQRLSEKRAKSIHNYLLKANVPATRVKSIGYGESQPLNNNATKAEKAANRRVTFTNMSEECDINISKFLNNMDK